LDGVEKGSRGGFRDLMRRRLEVDWSIKQGEGRRVHSCINQISRAHISILEA
jgi:hypothetical protein